MIHFNALRSGINHRVKRWVGLRYRALVEQSWSFDECGFWAYQSQALHDVLRHAVTRVPYYRDAQAIYRADKDSVGSTLLESLRRLPILPKETVRAEIERFRAAPLPPLTTYHTTSGTTGSPLRLSATLWERAFSQTVLENWIERLCGARAQRRLMLSGFLTPSAESREIIWKDPLSGHAYMSIYGMSECNREKIVEAIEALAPRVVLGYASAVYQLARFLGEDARNGRAERIALVTSEVLYPDWKEVIETNLCSNVYDYYGSQEGSHLVIACDRGHRHINPLIGIVEIVDERGAAVPAGDVGRVVVTGLARKSMPLIRYAIGDTAVSTGYATDCGCGLGWPTIGEVHGRSEDMVKTRDGRRIGYLAFHSFKNVSGVKEGQIIQRSYDDFLCNIVKDPRASADADLSAVESQIRDQVQGRLQARVTIEFRYLESIPKGANGKFKAVVVERF